MNSVPCAEVCRFASARTPDIERGSVRAVPYLYRYGTRHTPHHPLARPMNEVESER